MKNTFLSFLCTLATLPAFAQLGGDGYYRIDNATTGRYISIKNNKVDDSNKSAIKSGNNGNLFALETVGKADVVDDPGTIVFLHNEGGIYYTLVANGMNTKDLTGKTLKVYKYTRGGDKATPRYYMYGEQDGFTLYLKDKDGMQEGKGLVRLEGEQTGTFLWHLTPVDGTKEYFAIKPELTIDGKHYATMYTSFPYQLGTGMKAYYVKAYGTSEGGEARAELSDITSGKIPAATPVIIECASAEPAANKVTLLSSAEAPAAIRDNLLKSTYYCFVRRKTNGEEVANDISKQLKNVIEYNAATMRVLGVKDGKLCLVTATDMQYLPANRAYLVVNEGMGESLALLPHDQFILGVNGIRQDTPTVRHGIFTLNGQRVNAADRKGVYIIDGKKVVK